MRIWVVIPESQIYIYNISILMSKSQTHFVYHIYMRFNNQKVSSHAKVPNTS